MLDRAAAHPSHVTAETLRGARRDGVFHNAADEGFQESVHLEGAEVCELFETAGFDVADLLSVRGFAAWHEEALARIEERDVDLHAEFVDLIEETCRRPEVVATGAIALYVGRLEA